MVMFDIAEWIINLTVLGLGLFLWVIALFGIIMLFAVSQKYIREIR